MGNDKQLTPLVNAALGRELHLPARRPADLERLLQEVPDLRLLIIDGTERPVRRSKDQQQQRKDYSGKKKAHRKKNLLVTAERRVVYLGRTAPGSVHDKKLADRAKRRFPAGTLLVKDTGLQGYEPAGIATLQPKKKPKGRELRPYEKAINRVVSRARIVVEHAIAGGQALPPRGRHLPRLAQEPSRRGHARGLWPAQPARKLPRHCLKIQHASHCTASSFTPHKVYWKARPTECG